MEFISNPLFKESVFSADLNNFQLEQNPGRRSHWGCNPFHSDISTFLTDCNNNVVGPKYKTVIHKAWYRLQGYTSSSPFLVFPMTDGRANQRYIVRHTAQLRLWYGEDLTHHTEGDNAGRTCADVYVYI